MHKRAMGGRTCIMADNKEARDCSAEVDIDRGQQVPRGHRNGSIPQGNRRDGHGHRAPALPLVDLKHLCIARQKSQPAKAQLPGFVTLADNVCSKQ